MAFHTIVTSLAAEVSKETATIMATATATTSAGPTTSACVAADGTAIDCPPPEAPDVLVAPFYAIVLLIPVVFVAVALYSNLQERNYQRDQVRNRRRNEIELAELRRYWFPWEESLDEDEVPETKESDEEYPDGDLDHQHFHGHHEHHHAHTHEHIHHHDEEAYSESDTETGVELIDMEADIADSKAKANRDCSTCGRDMEVIETLMTDEVREEIRDQKESAKEQGTTTGVDTGDEGVVKRL